MSGGLGCDDFTGKAGSSGFSGFSGNSVTLHQPVLTTHRKCAEDLVFAEGWLIDRRKHRYLCAVTSRRHHT